MSFYWFCHEAAHFLFVKMYTTYNMFIPVLQSDSPQNDESEDPLGSGQQSELLIDECYDEPCDNGGTCISKLFGIECICAEGYKGLWELGPFDV